MRQRRRGSDLEAEHGVRKRLAHAHRADKDEANDFAQDPLKDLPLPAADLYVARPLDSDIAQAKMRVSRAVLSELPLIGLKR